MDGPGQLDRIFNALGLPVPDKAVEHLKIASVTANHGNPWETKNPIGNWQKSLNSKQIELILEVVESFGMSFYTDQLEPDYQKLYHPTLGNSSK